MYVVKRKTFMFITDNTEKKGNELTLPWAYYFEDMAVLCEKHHTEAHNIKFTNKV